MEEVRVRFAGREDCKGIIGLIQELADFEKMPEGPKIGADTLEKDGFGNHALFRCFVAEKNKKLIGYAFFYFTYSTWGGKAMYLEDLYVTSHVRGQGIGSSLFDAVAKEAVNTNCCRLDFSVLKWNPALDFYKNRGAIDITETESWHHYRLSSEALKKMSGEQGRRISESRWNLNEEEEGGILSHRLIEGRLSLLAKYPHDDSYALTKCNLSHMNLLDITELQSYVYIQYLDLSHNNLDDLSPLSKLPYLVYLDISHNKLLSSSKLSPPIYLTHINLSYNNITIMNDLSGFWSIVHLDLSHNSIEFISGLQNLKHLKHLNLSHNLIDTVRNLDNLNIENLNLEFNRITKFRSSLSEGLDNLRNLRTLFLNHNKISSLFFLRNTFHSLRMVDLRHNKIGDLLGVSSVRGFLDEIDLRGNSCTTWPYYREVLLHSMSTLTCIDGCEVTISERVSATTKFNPPVDLLSSKALSKLILLEQLIPPRIDDSVTPYDQSDPVLIVLTGPSAVKKILMGLTIAKKMPAELKYCRSYTTREVSALHDEAKAYKFVEREHFNAMARNGEFLTVEELVGDSYGFHAEEIAALRKGNKIGITQMDLGATIQLKHRYPNVKLVLVMTKNDEIHRQWIRDKFKIFTWIKDSVENLLALTIGRLSCDNHVESAVSKANFISQIISEIIQDLDIPTYCIYVRPQGTGATATDIILQSRVMLSGVTKTAKEIIAEKHIQFEDNYGNSEGGENVSSQRFSDLKVILDEQKNIVIDDEESKKKRRIKKFLNRRKAFEEHAEIPIDLISESSDESQFRFFERFKRTDEPKYLMNFYVEVVMRSREMYVNRHLENPGFYSLTIFSDDYNHALSTLVQFINTQVNQKSARCRTLDIEYRNKVIIPRVIHNVLNELNENFSQGRFVD